MKFGTDESAGTKAGESMRQDLGLVEALRQWVEDFRAAPPDWSDVFRGLIPALRIAGRADC
jgi:hypothetical protein